MSVNNTARFRYNIGLALSFLILAALGGCMEPTVTTKQVLPAKNPAAAALTRVAVLPAPGSSDDFTLRFESMLTEITYNGMPYFTVVDRKTLGRIVNELKLQKSGLTDDKTVAKIGKLAGAQAIYAPTSVTPPPVLEHHVETHIDCNGTNCSPVQVSCTDKYVQFGIIPRLVSVETGRVVYSPTVVGLKESSFCTDGGGEEADEVLRAGALEDSLEKIREDVAPYTKVFMVRFKSDHEELQSADRPDFDNAMAFAKSGRLDRACGLWAGLSPRAPTAVALNYDLAVCDEAADRLEEALHRYKQIDTALTKPDKDVNDALTRVQSNIDSRRKLAATTAPQPVPATTKPTSAKKVPRPAATQVPAPSPAPASTPTS